MIELYLVRHGQTVWNHSGRYQGITDVELSELGIRQAQAVAEYFLDIPLDAIYASDLDRAYQTALPLAVSKGLEIEKRTELREINFGAWEGLTYEEINARWPGNIEWMYANAKDVRIEGGESFGDVQLRASRIITEIAEKYPDGSRVAIVCHGGTIRCLLCYLLHIDLDLAWNFKQDNANISIVHYYGERNLLALLNDVHHLHVVFNG